MELQTPGLPHRLQDKHTKCHTPDDTHTTVVLMDTLQAQLHCALVSILGLDQDVQYSAPARTQKKAPK